MIGRLWHGWTAPGDDADAYERFLRDELFPRLESIEAIRVFAGDDYETPVIEPEAARVLWHYQDRVAHFELAVAPGA